MRTVLKCALSWLAALAVLAPCSAAAQNRPEPDRSDPSVIQRERNEDDESARPATPRPTIRAPEIRTAPQTARDVVAGAILVQGARRLPTAAYSQAIEPFLNRPLTHEDLVALATAVARVARTAGYGLATAWVPEQTMTNGILRVEVDEGRIDALRVSGPAASYVERQLASLADGTSVRTDELERRLLLASDGAGLWIGDARLNRENGRNVLELNTRYQRVEARVTVDNWGSDPIGPVRAWAELSANGIATRGDGLTVGVGITPLDPSVFQLVEAQYRTPLGGGGTTLGFGGYYGRTDVEPDANSLGYDGASWGLNVELSHALARSRAASLWVSGRFDLRDSEFEQNGVTTRSDRLATASLSMFGTSGGPNGRTRVRATLVQGLNAFDATLVNDPLASRPDAGGRFTKVETWANHWQRIAPGLVVEIAGKAQVSDGPLLLSEEIGLGGPQFLRAFNYRELSGDEGVAGSVEVRFNLRSLVPSLGNVWIYSYTDAGQTTNDGGRGRSGSLASAGAGGRFTINGNIELGLELGVPLTEGYGDTEPPPRVSFSVNGRF